MPRNNLATHLKNEWTTKDGRVIPISEMADIHVLRTVRLLEARLVSLGLTETKTELDVRFRSLNMNSAQAALDMFKKEADRRKLGDWGKFGIGLVKKALLSDGDE